MTSGYEYLVPVEEGSTRRTYLESLELSACFLGRPSRYTEYREVDRVEIWYAASAEAPRGYFLIEGQKEAQAFLGRYSSFAEVQSDYVLPSTLDYIRCVSVGKGTIDEFYRDGRSLLAHVLQDLSIIIRLYGPDHLTQRRLWENFLPHQEMEEEISADELTRFENEVWLVKEAATKENVTHEHVKRALALFEKLNSTSSPTLLTHPQLQDMQEVLHCYHNVASALLSLRNRWAVASVEDRKKGYSGSNQGEVILTSDRV